MEEDGGEEGERGEKRREGMRESINYQLRMYNIIMENMMYIILLYQV